MTEVQTRNFQNLLLLPAWLVVLVFYMHQVIHPFQVEPLPSTTTSSRRKRSAEPPRRVCSLALVADHIFHKEVGGGDIASTVLQMLYHVREANAVFLTKVGQVAL